MLYMASSKTEFYTCHTMVFSCNVGQVLVIPVDCFDTWIRLSTACKGHIQKDV